MRTILLGLLLLLPVHAQEARKTICRFLALDSFNPPPELLNVVDKAGEVRCTVTTNKLSPEVECLAKGNAVNFLFAADRKPAASATLPAKGSAFIMVFVAAAKNATLPWRVFVIEDTAKNFPDGGAFVANFHNQDIRFVLGEDKLMLHSAGSHGFAMPAKRDAFNMAPVMFEFMQNDQWRTASESMLRFTQGLRYLMFAYIDPESGRPKIVTYQDSGPKKITAPPR